MTNKVMWGALALMAFLALGCAEGEAVQATVQSGLLEGDAEPTATVHFDATPTSDSIFSPVQVQGFNSEVEGWRSECLAMAQKDLESPIALRRMRETNISRLTDEERFAWREELQEVGSGVFYDCAWCETFFACASFWSEPVTLTNGHKRNWTYADACLTNLGLVRPSMGRQALRFEARVQHGVWEMMQVPYQELSAIDRMTLRSWLGFGEPRSNAFRVGLKGCSAFYPQLSLGRWIPLFDGAGAAADSEKWGISQNGFLGIYNGMAIVCGSDSVSDTIVDERTVWTYDPEGEVCYRN